MRFCCVTVGSKSRSSNPFTNHDIACGLWLHNRKCMRPPENWAKPKDPDEKEKHAPRNHNRKDSSSVAFPPSDASQGTAPSSGATSPVHSNNNGHANQCSTQGETKSNPAPPTESLLHPDAPPLDEVSAAAALQKAIQSSPARLVGSRHSPIEVQDLTPRPTRRLLFPSPTGSQASAPLHETDPNSQRSALTTPSKAAQEPKRPSDDQDKENQPPGHPTSPTLFKTPFKTPNRAVPANNDLFSPSTANALPLIRATPKRTPSGGPHQALTELTPFTAQLNQMLSEANQSSPTSNGFDLPALPSLRDTPGRTNMQFDFSNFDSQDFLSTDLAMPSSPPALWGVYEDPDDQGTWPFPATPKSKRYSPGKENSQKAPGLTVDENGRASVGMAE